MSKFTLDEAIKHCLEVAKQNDTQVGECCCPSNGGCDTDYQWRYTNEVKKLIGDESNGI